MASNSQRQPYVLEYSKRRFDGGTERELIEQIEMQQQLMEQARQAQIQAMHPYMTSPLGYGNTAVASQQPVMLPPQPQYYQQQPMQQHPQPMAQEPDMLDDMPAVPERTLTRRGRVMKAAFVPYIELILGLSGLLIGSVMSFVSFRSLGLAPEVVSEERRLLMQHSMRVVRDSVFGIVTSPWRVFQAALLPIA